MQPSLIMFVEHLTRLLIFSERYIKISWSSNLIDREIDPCIARENTSLYIKEALLLSQVCQQGRHVRNLRAPVATRMKRIVSLKRVSIVAGLALGFMLRFVCGPSTTSFYGNPNQCLCSPSLQRKILRLFTSISGVRFCNRCSQRQKH